MKIVPSQINQAPTIPDRGFAAFAPVAGARYFTKSENRSMTKPNAMIATLVCSHAKNVRSLA